MANDSTSQTAQREWKVSGAAQSADLSNVYSRGDPHMCLRVCREDGSSGLLYDAHSLLTPEQKLLTPLSGLQSL